MNVDRTQYYKQQKDILNYKIVCVVGLSALIIIIIIIIINDNVYGAVIVTMVTARVHPVHLMNAA